MKIIFAAATAAMLAAPAMAQTQRCGPHDDVVQKLREGYSETVRFRGLADSTHVLELFLSPEGSWTAVMVDANGMACLVAAGQAGTIIAPAALGIDG
jgi:predicted DNA-binding protein (UPF0278 family)